MVGRYTLLSIVHDARPASHMSPEPPVYFADSQSLWSCPFPAIAKRAASDHRPHGLLHGSKPGQLTSRDDLTPTT
jgi:hypothetical protein